MNVRRIRYVIQLLGTLAILALVPTNIGKLIAFLALWVATFGRLTKAEGALAAIVCLFFFGMNAAALKQGIFRFSHPDVLGMPVYELAMWGFYVLHTRRMLDGPAPGGRQRIAWTLAVLYAACFGLIPDPNLLLMGSGTLLVIGLVVFREPLDWAYAGYMTLLGAMIEYTGVWSGEWSYPVAPAGGVPPWFVTLWGGVGLFLRRVALPLVARAEHKPPIPSP